MSCSELDRMDVRASSGHEAAYAASQGAQSFIDGSLLKGSSSVHRKASK